MRSMKPFHTVRKWEYISADGRYTLLKTGHKKKTFKLIRDNQIIASGNLTANNAIRFTKFENGLVESILDGHTFGHNMGDFFRYISNYDMKFEAFNPLLIEDREESAKASHKHLKTSARQMVSGLEKNAQMAN